MTHSTTTFAKVVVIDDFCDTCGVQAKGRFGVMWICEYRHAGAIVDSVTKKLNTKQIIICRRCLIRALDLMAVFDAESAPTWSKPGDGE